MAGAASTASTPPSSTPDGPASKQRCDESGRTLSALELIVGPGIHPHAASHPPRRMRTGVSDELPGWDDGRSPPRPTARLPTRRGCGASQRRSASTHTWVKRLPRGTSAPPRRTSSPGSPRTRGSPTSSSRSFRSCSSTPNTCASTTSGSSPDDGRCSPISTGPSGTTKRPTSGGRRRSSTSTDRSGSGRRAAPAWSPPSCWASSSGSSTPSSRRTSLPGPPSSGGRSRIPAVTHRRPAAIRRDGRAVPGCGRGARRRRRPRTRRQRARGLEHLAAHPRPAPDGTRARTVAARGRDDRTTGDLHRRRPGTGPHDLAARHSPRLHGSRRPVPGRPPRRVGRPRRRHRPGERRPPLSRSVRPTWTACGAACSTSAPPNSPGRAGSGGSRRESGVRSMPW
jgi:hypothetical protein